MSVEDDFSFAEAGLRHLGFEVTKIPEVHDSETADWKAAIEGETLLVEEKTKFEDADEIAKRAAAYAFSQPFATHIPLMRNNRLSGISRKAAGQLAASAKTIPHQFRIVWFTATGHNHEAKARQYVATLYGSTGLIERGRLSRIRKCYFFRNSDFYLYRNRIDAAVVAQTDGRDLTFFLYLNSLSDRYPVLVESRVRAAFKGVIDPIEDEREANAFIVDGDVDRARQNDVLDYVRQKYGTDYLMEIDMGMSSVSTVVDRW
jgi:hypothetical protein